MALDLTGLGLAAGGALTGYDEAARRRMALAQQNLELQDAQRKKAALAIMLSGIDPSQAGGGGGPPVPQQQGQAPAGMMPPGGAQPPMQQLGMAPGGPPMMRPPQSFSPQNPVPPGPPGPGPGMVPQMQPPAGGPPMQPPGSRGMDAPQQPGMGQPGAATPLLTQMAGFKKRIMEANPDADPATVAQAVLDLADLASKDTTAQTRLLATQMTQQGGLERTLATIQGRLEGIDKQQEGADNRQQMRTAAVQAHQQSQQAFTLARDRYLQGFAGMKEADKVAVRGALQKWQGALALQRTILNTKPDDADAQKKAADAVDDAEQAYNDLVLRKKKAAPGGNVSRETTDGDDNPPAPKPKPKAGAAEAGVPPVDPSKLPDGTTATKGGVTYTVKAGKWVKS